MINTSFKLHNLHISVEKASDKSIFRGASGVTFGAVHQEWQLKDSLGEKIGTIKQQSAPVTVSVPLANRLLLTVTNSGVSSHYSTLNSMNIIDTRVGFSFVFPGEKFWFTGSVSVPTGKTKLSTEDLELTNKLSQTAFGYKVPTFGQGLSGNASLVYAGSLTRRMVLGFGLSYFYKGSYNPVAVSTSKYDPGDEISLNMGFDYITYSKDARISLDVTSTYFFDDALIDASKTEGAFRSGPRVIGTVIYSLKTGAVQHTALLRTRYRLPNTYILNNSAKSDASLQVEGQYAFGTMLNTWCYASIVGEGKYYTPDQIVLSSSVVETGNAAIGAAGADLTVVSWGWIQPTLGARYAMGNLTISGADYDVNGIDASLTVRVAF
jgi:hypothetical protein